MLIENSVPIWELHTISPWGQDFVYCIIKFKKVLLNYTLSQLRDRVNNLIKVQGEDAHCAAWIYTKEDCHLKDKNGEIDYDNVVEDSEVVERIFDDVGNIDYIYQVIQECVDEVTEEQVMLQQQELV